MEEQITDIFSQPPERNGKRRVFSVGEITLQIKSALESNFHEIWVEGEISNFRPSSSGHCYFSLKEEGSVLNAVIFSRTFSSVKFRMEDGLKVVCYGSIDVYAPRGQYQLIIEKVEPKGIGSLQLALEQLKEKLEKEGLFRPERKKPIPYLPGCIGVVTSPTGAAIKDILKVLERRFKDVHIILNPVKVQGDGAREEIAQAIKEFNLYNEELPKGEKIEVLIVGRGGGSIEDLWAFNEEVVCRAIAASKIPVISAVGHERDVTVSDLVADLRAPTPSAAAEIVIPRKEDLREKIDGLAAGLSQAWESIAERGLEEVEDLVHRLSMAVSHVFELNRNHLEQTRRKLSILNPAVAIPQYKAKIVDLARQIQVRMEHCVSLKGSRFSGVAEKLASLNPLNILGRGYSVTFAGGDGERIVKDAATLSKGDIIRTRLSKGEILSEVKETRK